MLLVETTTEERKHKKNKQFVATVREISPKVNYYGFKKNDQFTSTLVEILDVAKLGSRMWLPPDRSNPCGNPLAKCTSSQASAPTNESERLLHL